MMSRCRCCAIVTAAVATAGKARLIDELVVGGGSGLVLPLSPGPVATPGDGNDNNDGDDDAGNDNADDGNLED